MESNQISIDQQTLSRQLATYGFETQHKIMTLRIFIHSLSGLGIEVAKNIVLNCPRSVTLYDPRKVRIQDVGRNFYCRLQDVGVVSRADASLRQLQRLNPAVQVSISDKDQINYISNNFDCVVVLDNYNMEYLIELNKAVRSNKVGFVYGGCLGLYGFTFVDFGDNHVVMDESGEQSKKLFISNIEQSQKGLVYLHQDSRHSFIDGDTVVLKHVRGMTQVNEKFIIIKVESPFSFKIGNTTNFSKYVGGGQVVQVRLPFQIKFDDLQTSLRYPFKSMTKDKSWEDSHTSLLLHQFLTAILSFYGQNNRLTYPLDQRNAQQLIKIVRKQIQKGESADEYSFKTDQHDQKLVYNLALFADTQISPCSSFWGAIISQQVFKITGKYRPISQWFHYQFSQVLPHQAVSRTVVHDRYYDYRIVFGDQLVSKVFRSSVLVVGVGGLGCEYIKMLSLMGFSAEKGRIIIVDDDKIQHHNLNRQFLFNRDDIGKHKVEAAVNQTKKINSSCNIQGFKQRLCTQHEQVYDEQFWNGLDFVLSAVDNASARYYTDKQCIWYEKPLFDAGTDGTKCHTQVILPYSTASYSDYSDPFEAEIPVKMRNSFPYKIEDCIYKAKNYFETIFQEPSQNLSAFIKDKHNFLQQLRKKYTHNLYSLQQNLKQILDLYNIKQSQYKGCVEIAVSFFQATFNHNIRHLLQSFPADHTIEETGMLFWSGRRCAPRPIELDLNDPLHLQLVSAIAKILADIVKLPSILNKLQVKELASKINLTPFKPKKRANLKKVQQKNKDEPLKCNHDSNSKVQQQISEEDALQKSIQLLQQKLKKINIANDAETKEIEFQKDVPSNCHVDFIAATTNLIARNYHIEEISKFKVQLISGRIIPAVVSPACLAVGAIGIQIIKYLLNKKIESHKNMTSNLALPLWLFSTPSQPIFYTSKQFDMIMCGPVKAIPQKFTKWQKIRIRGPITVQQLKKKFQDTYKITVQMISYRSSIIYSSFTKRTWDKLCMKVNVAAEDLAKKQLPKNTKALCLEICGTTSDGIDCLLPQICYEI